jgi:5'-nucleotidase
LKLKPRILVSNDDGVRAEGLAALAAAVEPLGEVWVVAPEQEQSAASHALSLHRPLRIRRVRDRWYSIDGTPADCVYLAVHHLLKGDGPKLVVSGINHGPNLADDVIYSGTVAAAMEGCILGFPAIAFSLVSRREFEFSGAAAFARAFVKVALRQEIAPRTLINVNVPVGGDPRKYEITRLGRHSWTQGVVEKEDPRGRRYYWIGGNGYEHEHLPGTDCTAVHEHGRISVTPLMLDLTSSTALDSLKGWAVRGFNQHQTRGSRLETRGKASRTRTPEW